MSRGEAEVTTLFEALDRYEAEVVPTKNGAVQEASVIRLKIGRFSQATARSDPQRQCRSVNLNASSATGIFIEGGFVHVLEPPPSAHVIDENDREFARRTYDIH